MTRVLVTGAEGFVGRRLVTRLARDGSGVEVVACHEPGRAPEPEGPLAGRRSIAWTPLDICNREGVEHVFRTTSPQAVIHLAGLSDVAASWRRIDDYYRVNVRGSENVATAARRLSTACRIVVASSAEVYGRVPKSQLPVGEARELRPRSPYALTKAAVERLTLPLGAIVVRSFNLIGPGQSRRFALPSFAAQLARIAAGRQEPVLRVGNLTSSRDFVHVDDGADAYAILAERGVPGSVYNVARGEAIRLDEALGRLIEISRLEVEIREDSDRLRPADVPAMAGDAGQLRALGWRPRRTVDQALEAIWQEARRAAGV